jgi:hypothetical protein
MTPEQGLNRLERIALLMAKTGARARRQLDEKISALVDAQIKSEDRLAENQARSDARLDRLVETVDRYISERRGGNP